MIMSIGIENSLLHQRIALKVLISVGTSTKRLLAGFIISSAALSMWVNNVACAAMMMSIVDAIIEEIKNRPDMTESEEWNEMSYQDQNAGLKIMDNSMKEIRRALLLGVAYASSIGGTGTLIGANSNMVLQGVVNTKFPDCNEISFGIWMLFSVPGVIVSLLITWVTLYLIILRKCPSTDSMTDKLKSILQYKYRQLGNISFHEGSVIFLLILMIILLFFRDPGFIPGWSTFLSSVKIDDGSPAVAVIVFMFLIPSSLQNYRNSPTLLEWKIVQEKMNWGYILLIGGGYSMAHGFEVSGLSRMVQSHLDGLRSMSPDILLVVFLLLTIGMTELASNSVVATAFLPLLADMALAMKVNPLFFMVPAAITCSYAFMLPIATPPNAVVFASANMKTTDMAIPGLVMNLLCWLVPFLSIKTLGNVVFSVNTFPDWATGEHLLIKDNLTTTVLASSVLPTVT